MAVVATLARSTPADAIRASERSCAPGSDPEHCWGPIRPDSGLVQLEGEYYGGPRWEVTRSLRGVVPPAGPDAEEIRNLTIHSLDGRDGVGLAPIAAFKDLRSLTLDRVDHADLAPLAALHLEQLRIEGSASLDLAPLAALQTLESLELVTLEGQTVIPPVLVLSEHLEALMIYGAYAVEGTPWVERLIAAIDWARVGGLQGLYVTGAGIRVDLGLLKRLTRLRALDLANVEHGGPGPSPLAPPFTGLPGGLKQIRIDRARPGSLEAQLKRRFGRKADVVVRRGYPVTANQDWSIAEGSGPPTTWQVYGSLAEAIHGDLHVVEEDGVFYARRRLKAVDPGLLRRLDFDSEGDGTGIYAARRADLIRMLRILCLTDGGRCGPPVPQRG